MSNLIVQ
jgi:hypothetical protein